eukprot:10859883-Lingulodinium_polyedra.AAC.1
MLAAIRGDLQLVFSLAASKGREERRNWPKASLRLPLPAWGGLAEGSQTSLQMSTLHLQSNVWSKVIEPIK